MPRYYPMLFRLRIERARRRRRFERWVIVGVGVALVWAVLGY